MSILNRNVGGKTLGVGSRLDIWIGEKNVKATAFKIQGATIYFKFMREKEKLKEFRNLQGSNISRAQQGSSVIGLDAILNTTRLAPSQIYLKERHSDQKLSENLENMIAVNGVLAGLQLEGSQVQYQVNSEVLPIVTQFHQILESVRDNHLTIIRGPPGTGKTYHLAIAIQYLSQILQNDASIVVCTQSNYAADQVLNQVLQVMPQRDDIFCLRPAARGRDFIGRAYDVTLWQKLRHKLRYYIRYRLPDQLNSEFSQFERESREQLREILIRFHREKLIYDIICQSKIIICTVAYYNSYLYDKVKCQVLVMDEASQVAECDLIQAYLNAGPRRFILTGDENQLMARQYQQTEIQSVFKLLADRNPENVTKLSYCFRMEYRLFALTKRVFYEDRIIHPRTKNEGTLQFINCGGRALIEGTSLYNPQQIHQASNIIDHLFQWYHPEEIGVLCFYISQRIKVNEYFDRLWYGYQRVKVGTVDSFQGQEFKAVILLTTVTNFVSKFMQDKHRVNVATSRAKELLYIVGNRRNLRKNELWKTIIDSIDEINEEETETIPQPIHRPTLDELRPRQLINGHMRRL